MAWKQTDPKDLNYDADAGPWRAATPDAKNIEYGRILDLVSEGPIGGLVGGLKSVYLEDTPIQNADGSFNFRGVNVVGVAGTLTQSYLPGFPSVESETSVVTQVTTGASVTRTISQVGATAARVKVSLPALQVVNPSTGAVVGGEVQIAIDVQNNGGGFVAQNLANNGVIRGKFSTKFVRGYRVSLPAPGPWDIRVRRITANAPNAYTSNDTYFESLTTITDSKLRYPGSACFGVVMDSKQFRSIPSRAYEIKGRLIQVPANYDPVARTYATTGTGTSGGIWDGTFKTVWSDNPAWIWYDLALHTRYGGGTYLDASKVDKWTLYAISQVCDAYVPAGRSKRATLSITGSFAADATNSKLTRAAGSWITDGFQAGDEVILSGFSNAGNNHRAVVQSVTATDLVLGEITLTTETAGSRTVALQDFTEPRFTCNVYLQTANEAIQVLNDLASIFRGVTYWAAGTVVPVQDVDASPVALFTNSNVKDGKFAYSGTSLKARHTVAVVSWNDPNNGYKQALEYVEDAAGIARYGLNPVQVVAIGSTSQGQARRVGKWILLSELGETDTVTFTPGMEGAVVRPGQIIQIQDRFRASARLGGRIATGATTTVIPLDAPVTLTPGTSYTLSCVLPNGTVESKAVSTGAGIWTSLTVGSAFSSAPGAQAQWVLAVTGSPLLYRVISVAEDQGTYTVVALIHDPTKYATVDASTQVTPTTGSGVSGPLSPVTSLSLSSTPKLMKSNLLSIVTATWTGNSRAIGYIAQINQNNTVFLPMTVSGTTATAFCDPDVYAVRVFAVYPNGMSTPVESTITVPDYATSTRATDVTAARVRSATFTTTGANTWTCPDDVYFVDVLVQAAGGGGGAGSTSGTGGAGAGAGGCLEVLRYPVVPNTTYNLSVGAKGLGGATDGANGTDGGDSWFDSSTTGVVAKGGKKGSAAAQPAAGGVGGDAGVSTGFKSIVSAGKAASTGSTTTATTIVNAVPGAGGAPSGTASNNGGTCDFYPGGVGGGAGIATARRGGGGAASPFGAGGAEGAAPPAGSYGAGGGGGQGNSTVPSWAPGGDGKDGIITLNW